jgi:hypothetical protein
MGGIGETFCEELVSELSHLDPGEIILEFNFLRALPKALLLSFAINKSSPCSLQGDRMSL